MSNLYDIDQDAIADTATMPLRRASGQPATDAAGGALSITFYGPGTKQFSAARQIHEEKQAGRTLNALIGQGALQTPEAKIEARARFLAAVTVSFNGFGRAGLTGHPLFMAVYSDPKLGHIAEQADEWVGRRANFLPQSANS